MIMFNIDELQLYGVYDSGIPNLERIVIRVLQSVDMGEFGLMLGIRGHGGSAIPIQDNMLWFGHGYLSAGDWIFVYTSPGQAKVIDVPNTEGRIVSVHWGKSVTIFNGPEFLPILFRIGAIQVPPVPLLVQGPQTTP